MVSFRTFGRFSRTIPGIFLFVAALLLGGGKTTYGLTVLVSDDFNDNSLNPALWTVGNWTSTVPARSINNNVVEQNQRIEITHAAKLITVGDFAPGAQPEAGLQITGRVTFATNFEAFRILTRSDGITPNPSDFGSVQTGVEFAFDNANNMTINGIGGAVITGLTNNGNVPKATGETYDFFVRDDGTNLTFTMTQVGGSKQRTVTAASVFAPAVNKIVMHNRENSDGNHTLFLDDVTIASPSSLATTTPGFEVKLHDNFNDNSLDASKWNVNLVTNTQSPAGTTTFSESSGRANLQNRAYLSTVEQFDPLALGGLEVAGQVSLTTASSRGVIVVRSDATPNTGFFGMPRNGIAFTLNGDGAGLLQAHQYVNGVETNLGSLAVSIITGELYDFLLTDDGTNLVFTITQVGGDTTTGTLAVTSGIDFAQDFVLFTTREFSQSANRSAFFDNIFISAPAAAIPEPASLSLLAMASMSVLATRRRRQCAMGAKG